MTLQTRLPGDNTQLSAVRQKRLLEVVRERGAMNVRDLSDYLQVSGATIRRDLSALQRKGLLARTHGGVVANSIVAHDLPENARLKMNEEEKQRIASAALEMLDGEETVLLDAGTTALTLAMHAATKPNCTYVTTSLGIARALKDQGIKQHYLIGGAYHEISDSYTGSLTISALRSLAFDIAFLCVSSIDVNRRMISLGSETYAQVQKEIVTASRKTVVLADHSKFKAAAFACTATFDDLDAIITVADLDDSVREALEREDLELTLV